MDGVAHILLVEGDARLRMRLRDHLTKDGYGVAEAGSVTEALALLTGDRRVDFVVTDVLKPMPDGAGFAAAAQRLRRGLAVLSVYDHAAAKAYALSAVPCGAEPEPEAILRRIGHVLGYWTVEQNPVLQRAYRYWAEKAAGRPFPPRNALDPAEIKDLLPYVSIYERVGDPPRLRCRLMGTKVVEAVGNSITQRFVEDVVKAPHAGVLVRVINQVMDGRAPLYAASNFRTPERGLSTERLLLPFGLPDGAVQAVIVQTFGWGARPVTLLEITQNPGHRHEFFEWRRGPDPDPDPKRKVS